MGGAFIRVQHTSIVVQQPFVLKRYRRLVELPQFIATNKYPVVKLQFRCNFEDRRAVKVHRPAALWLQPVVLPCPACESLAFLRRRRAGKGRRLIVKPKWLALIFGHRSLEEGRILPRGIAVGRSDRGDVREKLRDVLLARFDRHRKVDGGLDRCTVVRFGHPKVEP